MLKTVLAAVLAATALVPAAALAQDGHWQGRNGNGGNRGGGGGGQWHGNPGGGGQWNGGNRQFQPRQEAPPQAQQQAQQPQPQFRRDGGNWQNRGGDNRPAGNWQGRNGDGVRPYQAQQPRQFQPQGNPNFRRRPESYNGYNRGGYDGYNRGGYNDGNRGYQGGYANRGNWNRDWRRDGRYDYGGYRAQNRYAYHLPRYYAPGGWGYGYRRFGIGFALNEILFSQDYWIDDPYNYRLPEAYGPYRWVRYYNDALLVDIDSGQVVDAVYGIFW